MAGYQPPQPDSELQREIEVSRTQIAEVFENITTVIKGKEEVIKKILIAILADGHVLLYDVPGVGKTVLAKTLSRSINSDFKRIQFTPDLLPSDISGVNVYNPAEKSFEFQRGPIFANIVLADEINRTSPKTQASLLEAMEERQVTVDNETYQLPEFFFVVATQNPVEHDGTYPLPAAQLDRFLFRLEIGYPDAATEIELVEKFSRNHPLQTVEAVTNAKEIKNWQELTKKIYVARSAAEYAVQLARKTREISGVNVGISPRGAIMLIKAAKATAILNGRDYVLPDDIRYIVTEVFSHRLSEASQVGENIVREVVNKTAI